MSALTSLLVRDRAVSVSKIEEALQQQVLRGGDIETILLEMNLVPEDVLSAYRAALYGLLPATREEVMRASREARTQMPSEMARALGVVPILFEGRCLVVAAAEPLSEEVVKQVRAKLGCELSVRIVTQMRLAAGLAHHYGFELDARSRRLADALRKRDPGVIPYVRPPTVSMQPSMRPPGSSLLPFGDEPDSREFAVLAEPPANQAVPLQAPQGQDGGTPQPDPEAAQEPAASQTDGAASEHAEAEESEEAASEPGAQGAEGSEEAPRAPIGFPERHTGRSPLAAPRLPRESVLAGFQIERNTTVPPSTVSTHMARALRGPVSSERVEELLHEAAHRDDVLFVLLRYAQQFFDFVAIFSVGKEGARGRMAHGAGLSQELMEHVVVPLTGQGLAARAARDKRVLVGDWSTGDEERAALALLGGRAGRPGLAIPMMLGTRVTLLVYADREGEGLSVADAEPVTRVAPAIGDALRRLIVAQKTLRGHSLRPSGEPASAQQHEASGVTPVVHEEAGSGVTHVAVTQAAAGEPESPVGSADEPHAQLQETMLSADGLTAVDLQAVSRLSLGERRFRISDSQPSVRATSVAPEARETARGRVPGVPRSAPPPPMRDSVPPAPSAGAYSYVSASGAVREESVRSARHVATLPLAVDLREAPALSREAAPDMAEANAVAPEPAEPAADKLKVAGRPAARLSLVTPDQSVPSVIIDMGEHVNALVDVVMRAAPHDELTAIGELVKLGEGVLPVLMQHFPGPLWFDPKQTTRRRPRGRDVSGLARCIVAFGPCAAPYLSSKLSTSEPDVCGYALMVAEELIHPGLLDAVARRAFDAHDGVRALALEVLRSYEVLPQFEGVLRGICELSTRPGKDPRRQRLAVEALAELRDARAFRTLVQRLADPSETITQTAHRALVLLTGQDLGPTARRWEQWGEQVQGTHRVEWLIEALAHPEESLRALASEELKQLTQQYFGYHPAQPKRDRELAQRKYRDWWEREGRALFKR